MPRLALVLFLAVASAARAEPTVPMVLPTEGFLLDGDDKPVSATVDVTFALYSDADALHAPTPLWRETYSTAVANGHYAALLGDTAGPNTGKAPLTADLFGGAPLYLGITVGDAGAEMQPRLRVASVPYALRAASSATVDAGAVATDQVKDGAITLQKLALTNGKFVGLDADTLDGLDSSAFAPASIESKVDAIEASVGDGLGTEVGGLATTLGTPPSGSSIAGQLATIAGSTNGLGSSLGAVATTLGTPPAGSSLAGEIGLVKATAADTDAKVGDVASSVSGLSTSLAGVSSSVGSLSTSVDALSTAMGNPGGTTLFEQLASMKTSTTDADGRVTGLAGRLSYSRDCTDYSAHGWSSRQECLQDGRWHKFGAWAGQQPASTADDQLLVTLIDAGADLKVQWQSSQYQAVFPVWYALPNCGGSNGRICLYTHKPVSGTLRTAAFNVATDSNNGYYWIGTGSDDGSFGTYVSGSSSNSTGFADFTVFVKN